MVKANVVTRHDFLSGHGKANQKDSLTRQTVSARRRLALTDLKELYAGNRLVQNIVDIPAEDMTRNWFTLKLDDDDLRQALEDKIRDLNAKQAFKSMLAYERLYGDGFVSIGTKETRNWDLKDELNPNRIKSIDYLHPFSRLKVSNFITNEDVFSTRYGDVEYFDIMRRNNSGIVDHNGQIFGQTKVHHSRLFHHVTRRLEDEYEGQSIMEPLFDTYTIFDSTKWSVGQILYDLTFKKLKSPGVDQWSREEKLAAQMELDFAFRTEALALLGVEEDLTKESTNVSGVKDLIDFVWEVLSGELRMPKSIIKGQEAGTITGAQYDVINYYNRIEAQQENELKPHLERLIRLLMQSEEFGRLDPASIDWELTFNPLWSVDKKTDAEINKIEAETDAIYIDRGVASPDEVRQHRIGDHGMSDLDLTNDEMDDGINFVRDQKKKPWWKKMMNKE
ncbi:DUF1073 domain-containing protein [Gracilibacillus oryzae]|uniref:DUF1073 domain-containing protein n=1 Tax=Gracilibacillus oryzae TaxID=1672701 RepID=A0A7C8GVQ5_9BACI|nr:anti-CBASS Acb1 family protein [Gracilibacillus oryzae]KAB8139276.1 DUF1073 domain-containing protein [Gracilibacillus oryzae]